MEVVLNIRHDYDLDVEDITELLVFRIAMIPKTWTDAYGDTIKKTSGEIAECLNQGKFHVITYFFIIFFITCVIIQIKTEKSRE